MIYGEVIDNADISMFCVNCCFYVNNHEHVDNKTQPSRRIQRSGIRTGENYAYAYIIIINGNANVIPCLIN
jgi:D-ribose pyranose/furanose isomerase RbsD